VSFPENNTVTDHPAVAVYVILEYPSMKLVYTAAEYYRATVPYTPSFLAFREMDPLLRLVRDQQSQRPELTPRAILIDGNGVLHTRGAGIACFLGVRTGIPTIGIGKTLFCEAGLTKELVSNAVFESMRAAVDFCTLRQQQQRHDSSMDQTDTCSVSEQGNKKPLLLFDRHAVQANRESYNRAGTHGESDAANRGSLIKQLSSFCHGLAIPLQGEEAKSNADVSQDDGPNTTLSSRCCPSGRILACALVGHGGRLLQAVGNKPSGVVGSQNPIFVSVGHKLSLQQAVTICAALSVFRIPEPVRQADLIGREMLRKAVPESSALDTTAS
jgi:deoxyinosine 3'endonuclease (endonuclease V)